MQLSSSRNSIKDKGTYRTFSWYGKIDKRLCRKVMFRIYLNGDVEISYLYGFVGLCSSLSLFDSESI